MELLERSLPDIKPENELFHNALKAGYGKAVTVKNYIHKVGKTVAVALGLDEPEKYTGHCFCCTAAATATNAGANALEMKRHFGWHKETTALKYADETPNLTRKTARLLTEGKSHIHLSSTCADNVSQTRTLKEEAAKNYNFGFSNANVWRKKYRKPAGVPV